MKRLMTISALVIACSCCAQGKRCIGLDISSGIVYGKASLNAGYSFSERWSAETVMTINAVRLSDGPDSIEREHWSDLYGPIRQFSDSDLTEISFSICFWPKNAFEGTTMSIGGKISDRSGPDLIAGAGYYCRIWKGIRAAVMYQVGLIECMNKGFKPSEGIKIGISYAF